MTDTSGPITAAAERITTIPTRFPAARLWWAMFAFALSLLGLYLLSTIVLFVRGVGVWGNNVPIGWGFEIINYIWWLGIGHAGTLISALLLLVGQQWRSSLNRFAEAMTLFAVMCAGLYPILHLGRPWRFYWMMPYFNTMELWPQFKSPLTWDFFAVLTYLTVSTLFWYIGILPDLAAARDRATQKRWQIFFGLGSLGWRGSARGWHRWNQSYRLTAALAVPLVVSVHSEISLLLAAGPLPGWNSTIFPPYFVLGAAFSGFAVVSMLTVWLRAMLGLHRLVTPRHLDMLGILTLTTGLMTAYGYVMELFTAFYAGGREEAVLWERLSGPYAWSYWGAVILNFVPLQLLWWRRVRTMPLLLFLVGLCATLGMWMERFMLLVTSLYKGWLPSSVVHYAPTFWDWSLFAGSIGLFLTCFLLFIRFLPIISAFEVEEQQVEHAHG
jgi:molybdopterin-containing oxidoreductase family membrane subunit